MAAILHQQTASCLALLSLLAGLSTALEKGEILDMTYTYDSETTLFWPGAPRFVHTILVRDATDNMPWLEMNKYEAAEHFGTHLDAPAHTAKGKWRTDEIPIERFVGPAVRVDISATAATNADYQLTVADLTDWVSANGPIPDGSLLFVFTGYGAHWSSRADYFGYAGTESGTDADGNSLVHFPGISTDAATWLVENTKIFGVGIDTASLDYGQSLAFESHQILLKENIIGLENVANLDKLPTTGATVYALPMKIGDGSGGPVRIIGMLTEETSNDGLSQLRSGKAAFFLTGIFFILIIIL